MREGSVIENVFQDSLKQGAETIFTSLAVETYL